LSYSGLRNKKGIAERRAVFGTERSFSDRLSCESTQDFGGGCFFGSFADVPENGYALSLNMDSCGSALQTRKEHGSQKIAEAVRRVQITDLIHGIDADELYTIGNASVQKSEANFLITCNFFAEEGEEYTEPGVYIMRELSAGKYLFRLYLGTGICPNIKIYAGTGEVQFEGKPDVLADGDGKRYIEAEFEASYAVRIDMTYSKGASETITHRFVRPMIINIGEAAMHDMTEEEAKSTLFDGASTVCTGTVAVPEGESEAEAFAGGKYIFKKGSCLFSLNSAGGECFLEYDSLPVSEKCAIYRYGSGFIAVCENGETVATDDFAPGTGVRKGSFYMPTHYLLYSGDTETAAEKNEDLNMFSEYFYVKLIYGGVKTYTLPKELPIDTEFCEAYNPEDMNILPEGDVTLTANDDGTLTLTEDSFCHGILVKLRLRNDSELYKKIKKFRELLFSPSGNEVFPSLYEKGHNIVLYGGENGAEFAVSALNENMYAAEGKTLISENTEKITSILRYSENFLVFSPHYIRKMIISENENGGFDFSMQNFKYDIGCDIPKSAVCADDKIIYANSRAGVFYINRFGFTEKDMSKHVSANIETGENGLLIRDESELAAAEAAVCDGKYFLRVGEFFYVWDFAHAVPAGTEKASEERKLKWLIYSGIPCRRMLGADEEKIYFLGEDGSFSNLARGTSVNSGAESYFCSREYTLSPFSAATVWKLSLSLAAKEPCTVRLYLDGEEGNSKYTLTPDAEKSTLCIVRPEARGCRSFAFSLHSFGAVRLDGVKIEYLPK